MRFNSLGIGAALVAGLLFHSVAADAWGERGHHIAGYAAAVATPVHLSADEKKRIGNFFLDRKIQFGHLNNIPDISWKNPSRQSERVRKLNAPTHHFGTEILLGLPAGGYDSEYLKKIRALDKDYKTLRAKYDGKPNPLPGAEGKKIDLYGEVGTAPYRGQQLFDLMVDAFKCAAGKPVQEGYRTPENFRLLLQKTDGSYRCGKKGGRREDIYVAIIAGGIMGHFVADLAQPHHASADYNGWTTGQGGIHAFIESFLVNSLDEKFLAEVATLASSPDFAKKVFDRLGTEVSDRHFPTQLLLNLVADSIQHVSLLREADRAHALVKEGEKLPWGSAPGNVYAERKSLPNADLAKKLQPFLRERLATAAVLLSRLWVEAWRAAGRPDLNDITFINVPYPLDVPFIYPTYDSGKKGR